MDILTGTSASNQLNFLEGSDNSINQVDHLFHMLKGILIEYMDDRGLINYYAIRASKFYTSFRKQTGGLHSFDPGTLSSNGEKLAFWINLYNILILDAVISLDFHKSVAEHLGGLGFFRKAAYTISGLRMSADDIEHGILRNNRGHPFLPFYQFHPGDPRMQWIIKPFDPRIHFALNCASASCPPIHSYQADKIDSQLDMAAKSFIGADLEIDQHKGVIFLSSIYKWFSGDFGGREKTLDFILKYYAGEHKDWMISKRRRLRFTFKPYDWGLNGKV
jgi:hypothetical protein